MQADRHVGPGQATAEHVRLSFDVADSQRALSDEASPELGQKTHLIVLHGNPCSLQVPMPITNAVSEV